MDDAEMDFTEYNKEVNKRLMGWIKLNKDRIPWTITIFVLGHILLYGYYYVFGGRDFANQNFLQILPALFLVDFLSAVGTYVFVAYKKIPAEIYHEQRKIIDNFPPSQLDIFVGPSPIKGWIYENNKDIQTAYLTIISREKKKIVEFHATRLELLQRISDMKPDLRGATFGSGLNNVRFVWENESVFVEVFPGIKLNF